MPRLAICARDARTGEYSPLSAATSSLLLLSSVLAAFTMPIVVDRYAGRVLAALRAALAAVVKSSNKPAKRRSTMSVLRDVRDAGGLGLDVGGTLAKLVVAEPARSGVEMPEAFGEDTDAGEPEGRTHRTLDARPPRATDISRAWRG